jgi:hypothetical protein
MQNEGKDQEHAQTANAEQRVSPPDRKRERESRVLEEIINLYHTELRAVVLEEFRGGHCIHLAEQATDVVQEVFASLLCWGMPLQPGEPLRTRLLAAAREQARARISQGCPFCGLKAI